MSTRPDIIEIVLTSLSDVRREVVEQMRRLSEDLEHNGPTESEYAALTHSGAEKG